MFDKSNKEFCGHVSEGKAFLSICAKKPVVIQPKEKIKAVEQEDIFTYVFYDPIAGYLAFLFGQQKTSKLGYVLDILLENFIWCMHTLIFEFQKYIGITSNTQMLGWFHWKVDFT